MGKTDELWPLVGRMAIGVMIVRIVTAFPHRLLCKLAVWFWGMGAISLALYRRLQPMIAPNIPPMPMTPRWTMWEHRYRRILPWEAFNSKGLDTIGA